MTVSDSSIFTSKPFTFIVQGKPLYVHAALIADCSEPLDRMINGHLSEAQQGFAVLGDVEEGTFSRFIRWAYNKDYPAVEHTPVETSNMASAPALYDSVKETVASDDLDWGSFTTTKKDKKKKKSHTDPTNRNLKEAFITQYDDAPAMSSDAEISIPGPRGNKGPEEDYTEVFLGHARMYVFAEKYDIQPLKNLALMKLHHTLAIFTLYPERVADILTLLKYVYANTAETVSGTVDIRSVLAHYVGCYMDILNGDGEIKDLMLENGEMLADFLEMFVTRVF